MKDVDIVITYLNSRDEEWQKSFNYYKNLELNNNAQTTSNRQAFGSERTREWDNLKYWFRGIEKNCPWIRKVFLVVQNERHIPKWLDKNNPKLRIVYHDEFIPKELLPTYSASVISFYLSNIKDLSENFIYSDDDFFFINPMKKEEFFYKDDIVLDVRKTPYKINDNVTGWNKVLTNNYKFIHRYMTNENECCFSYSHLAEPRIKSIEANLIKENYDEFIDAFKISKFRHANNYNWFLLADILKVNKTETSIERINKSKYIHYTSKINLFDYKDCQMICVNDTEAMDDFQKCRDNLLTFLNYKLPNKSSFELEDVETTMHIDEVSKCFGIISWLPNDAKNRQARIDRLNKMFEQIKNIFGDVEYLIVAQNWKDYKVPEFVHATIYNYDKLGILNARKTLGKHFLESSYDYLIMCDDDIVLEVDKDFSKDYFFDELDKHPNGFMFLQYGWSLTFCAVSRYIYSQTSMVDIDPEKNEGYEDVVYPWLLHYKHTNNEFKINGIKFVQHQQQYTKELKSTWNNSMTNHNKLHNLSRFYISEFKRNNFIINKEEAKKFLKQINWYEEAIWYGWITPEEYKEFKKKYDL